jgi:hypothetical protein
MACYIPVTERDLCFFLKEAPQPSCLELADEWKSSSLLKKADATATTTIQWAEMIKRLLAPIFPKKVRDTDTERREYITNHTGVLITTLLYDRSQRQQAQGNGKTTSDGYGEKLRLIGEKQETSKPLELRTQFITDGLVLYSVQRTGGARRGRMAPRGNMKLRNLMTTI